MKISLVAQQITKRYGAVTALADGNLETQSGEVMALMGANGSGKSTLGKIITGVAAPDQGQLLLDGKSIKN
jgi:ribose transport system ATP-binding protein